MMLALLLLAQALLAAGGDCAPEMGACTDSKRVEEAQDDVSMLHHSARRTPPPRPDDIKEQAAGGAAAAAVAAADGTCGNPSAYFECTGGDVPAPWGSRRRDLRAADAPLPPRSCQMSSSRPWCDPGEGAESRAQRLVAKMNFSELANQVSCDIFGGVPAIERLGVNQYNYIRENNHGLLWNDVCPVPTMFPQVITMAASFDAAMWTAVGEASAMEVRYNYDLGKQNSLFTQTNFNVFLDPRWGRGQEVPGESAEVNAAYARAWIRGVQAPKGPGGRPLAGTSCKHLAAYHWEGGGGWPDPTAGSNRHNFDAAVTAQDLADTHLPMYEACAAAGAMGMMTSYNAVNGVPSCANGNLTNGVARAKWGFTGAVVTDCGAVEDLWRLHKYVPDGAAAARAALEGGTDIECGRTIKTDATPDLEPLLRRAVGRAFRARFELGEFDPPAAAAPALGGEAAPPKVYDQAGHARLAYDAAVAGAVLLKNVNETLPLRVGLRVALMGPLRRGKWEMLGSYSGYKNSFNWNDSPNVVSPLEGLQDCELVGELVLPPGGPGVCSLTEETVAGTGAVAAKPDADVVVMVAGLYCQDPQLQDVDKRPDESGKCQAGCLESEGCDRPSLALPRGQQLLIRRAAAWGLPVVLVIVSGGPVDLEELSIHPGVGAILWMGYPGQAAGTALANLLFGRESPSGRLTQTFYRDSYVHQVSMKSLGTRPDRAAGYPGRGYRFVDPHWVVYPFGHGLSYHEWAHAWSAPPRCGPAAAGVCTGDPAETCFLDATCSEGPGASGCDAGGAGRDCRFCGFGHHVACPEPKAAAWTECVLTVETSMASSNALATSVPATSLLLFLRPPPDADPSAPEKELRHFARVRAPGGTTAFRLSRRDFELADAQGVFRLQEGRWLAELGQPAALRRALAVSASGCEPSA